MWRDRQGVKRGSATVLNCVLVIVWTATSSWINVVEAADDSVCNLDPKAIATSDKNLLKQLSQCQSFTPDQANAIQAVLRSEKSLFGPPSEWTSSTLDELRGFFLLFDNIIMKQIPKGVLLPWMKDFFSTFRVEFKPSRRKRAAECPPGKTITQEVIDDDLMPINYTAEELRACLKGPILAKNRHIMKDYAFTVEQLEAIQKNLDEFLQMYPNGYP